jgi:MYXO-CTERM domain-containing protein
MIHPRILSSGVLSLLVGLAACSTADHRAPGEAAETAREAIIKGKSSDTSQDAVVLLVHYDPTANGIGQCSGTLLAPNLVLTARHCVADTDEYAACKSDGTPIAAGVVRGNHPASTLYVFTGKDRPNFEAGDVTPAGVGSKVLDDGGKNLCNHDIALIVLQKPITDMPIAQIRLDSPVKAGEIITSVGWGVTDKTTFPDTRQQRQDVEILNVGPSKSDGNVPPNEFEVGESICSGDSGGPALDQKTKAVVGVVSRGGNASGQDQNDPSAACIDAKNLYTKVGAFKDFIMKGFKAAGAEPWLEGGPDPRKAKAKAACNANDDCQSALCLADPDADGAMRCAEDCSKTACSVDGEVCTEEADAKVCRAPAPEPTEEDAPLPTTTTTTKGCASAPSPAGSGVVSGALVLGLAALAGSRRRRR